ncbi:GNAT family N-acetyltransferase [Ornithinibacillus halotolerans]|uniref:Acetyltransferase n=1 Tax=Ornithinibacillus halotolerans TaxID=1274357 RepID=A0A916SCJ1_9BACI|nr:GNAT family N-acetyltransferase [Ornithinibacillus halotolerans]GGA93307.1 acetyltransferase [Ornithinibacillus halotolerans]
MLITKRCKLRPFQENDLDIFIQYRNNLDWMKYQNFKNKTKEEYRKALLVPIDLENGAQLAIVEKETDQLLGDLFLLMDGNSLMIGYAIHPTYARKGYITEVVESLLPKLKECYPSYDIVAMTDKENIPSINLLRKLGFTYTGWNDEWQSEVFVFE